MAKTPKEWADELLEAWSHGTDIQEQVAKWAWEDLREKAEKSFLLAQDQAYKRGLSDKSNDATQATAVSDSNLT